MQPNVNHLQVQVRRMKRGFHPPLEMGKFNSVTLHEHTDVEHFCFYYLNRRCRSNDHLPLLVLVVVASWIIPHFVHATDCETESIGALWKSVSVKKTKQRYVPEEVRARHAFVIGRRSYSRVFLNLLEL